MATFTQMKDEMKTCPYNPLHKVSARRLPQHIIKCSKNPSNPVLQDCPFNALHKIPANQLQQHILLCKDSRQIIREIEESRQKSVTAPKTNPIVIPVNRDENAISSEDWDQEVDKVKPYVIPGLIDKTDEEKEKEDINTSFKTNIEIQCMKPAERKKYYKQMVEKTKEKMLQIKEESNSSKTPSSIPGNKPCGQSSETTDDFKRETSDPGIRKPNTKPFNRLQGIGRGIVPISGRMSANRQIGVSREDNDSNSNPFSIKREREESYEGVKRFSPDLPKNF